MFLHLRPGFYPCSIYVVPFFMIGFLGRYEMQNNVVGFWGRIGSWRNRKLNYG
jgi:hypothetical protein